MTQAEARVEAAKATVQETRLVKNNKVFMCRLNNGVVGFGDTEHKANREAYRRCAVVIMRAVNSGRIAMLTAKQLKEIDRALH